MLGKLYFRLAQFSEEASLAENAITSYMSAAAFIQAQGSIAAFLMRMRGDIVEQVNVGVLSGPAYEEKLERIRRLDTGADAIGACMQSMQANMDKLLADPSPKQQVEKLMQLTKEIVDRVTKESTAAHCVQTAQQTLQAIPKFVKEHDEDVERFNERARLQERWQGIVQVVGSILLFVCGAGATKWIRRSVSASLS